MDSEDNENERIEMGFQTNIENIGARIDAGERSVTDSEREYEDPVARTDMDERISETTHTIADEEVERATLDESVLEESVNNQPRPNDADANAGRNDITAREMIDVTACIPDGREGLDGTGRDGDVLERVVTEQSAIITNSTDGANAEKTNNVMELQGIINKLVNPQPAFFPLFYSQLQTFLSLASQTCHTTFFIAHAK